MVGGGRRARAQADSVIIGVSIIGGGGAGYHS